MTYSDTHRNLSLTCIVRAGTKAGGGVRAGTAPRPPTPRRAYTWAALRPQAYHLVNNSTEQDLETISPDVGFPVIPLPRAQTCFSSVLSDQETEKCSFSLVPVGVTTPSRLRAAQSWAC